MSKTKNRLGVAKPKDNHEHQRITREVPLKEPLETGPKQLKVEFGNVERIKVSLLNAINNNILTLIKLQSKEK